MSLYYQDDAVTLYHCAAQQILATMQDSYTERTHDKARSNSTTRKDGVTEFGAIAVHGPGRPDRRPQHRPRRLDRRRLDTTPQPRTVENQEINP